MISRTLKSTLEIEIRGKVQSMQPAFGGDINSSYHIESNRGKYFVKTNTYDRGYDMFEKEADGLHELNSKGKVRTPVVISFGTSGNTHYLLMESVSEGRKSETSLSRLGEDLAKVHLTVHARFGWVASNYIGPLQQLNLPSDHWSDFYINQRIQPLIEDCVGRSLLEDKYAVLAECMQSWMEEHIPQETPSLIHGDLWSGNILYDKRSRPVLIDPAVSYCSREMDLAMMELFGGLDPLFLDSYHSNYPLQDGWEERLPFYKLYYLLVHLRLFGSGYKSSVTRILDPFL